MLPKSTKMNRKKNMFVFVAKHLFLRAQVKKRREKAQPRQTGPAETNVIRAAWQFVSDWNDCFLKIMSKSRIRRTKINECAKNSSGFKVPRLQIIASHSHLQWVSKPKGMSEWKKKLTKMMKIIVHLAYNGVFN